MGTGIRKAGARKFIQENLHLPEIQLIPGLDCCPAGRRGNAGMTDLLGGQAVHVLQRRQDFPDDVLCLAYRNVSRHLHEPEFPFPAGLHRKPEARKKLLLLLDEAEAKKSFLEVAAEVFARDERRRKSPSSRS